VSNATHATVPHTINGVEYQFSPLELEDLEWLELWLKARVVDAGTAAAMTTNKPTGDRILRMALAEAAEIDIFGGDFGKLLTPAGVSRMLYRMVIKNHPEVTIEQCRGWIATREAAEALTAKLDLLRAGGKEEPDTNGAPLSRAKTATRKRKNRSTERR
jgi:hypothetical protein